MSPSQSIRWTMALLFAGLIGCNNPQTETALTRQEDTMTDTTTQKPTEIPLRSISGDTLTLAHLGGKAFLVVNVASKCGFTPQYDGLEALYSQYKESGLVVVGLPCNQFGGQEPGTEAEILEFCQSNYSVTFPMMAKLEVKGEGQHPLYRYLTRDSDRPGEIQWNFTKFLLDPDGKVVARFEPQVKPEAEVVTSSINKLL